MTTDDVGRAKARMRGMLAHQLSSAAQLVKSRDQAALARPFPPASKAGDYAHRRSGRLLASVDYEPKSLGEIAQTQHVEIYRSAFYDTFLVRKGRRSLQDTVERLRGQLAIMFSGGVGIG